MDQLLHLSDEFVLSSGTVPIDIHNGLVLLLYCRPKGEYMLPKGRKNVGETLEDAAIRETFEDQVSSVIYSNISFAPMRKSLGTCITPNRSQSNSA